MCQKHGRDELETVRNLMAMSLRAVAAEALDVDIDDITGDARLVQELGMAGERKVALRALVADTFDGLDVDLDAMATFNDLLAAVVLKEFEGICMAEPEREVAEAGV